MNYVLGPAGARKWKALTTSGASTTVHSMGAAHPSLDNQMPYPFEVRWTKSLFSQDDNGNQGDYMINIPDGSLYINGAEINPSDYEFTVEPLSTDDSTKTVAKWYALQEIAPTSPTTKDLSSLQVWLDYSSAPPTYKIIPGLSASATDLSTMYSKMLLTRVYNYRSIPVVKSAIHLNSVMIPFRLSLKTKTPATPAEEPTYTWEMDQILFSVNGKVQYLANCDIPPSQTYGGMECVLRLCRIKNRFVIDRVKADEINSDELGEVLSGEEPEETTVQASYPLYSLSDRNLVTADLRHAWYIINDPVGDEATIALSADTANWSGDENLSANLGKLHLYHYYDHERDVGLWNPNEIDGREWCFPVRYEEYENEGVSADALQYVSLNNLTMYIAEKLSVQIPDYPGYPQWSEMEKTLSALSSVSADASSSGMFAWDNETKTMGPGGCMVGRTWVEATLHQGGGDGYYQLEVDHSKIPATAKVILGSSTIPAPTDTKCWIPIYTVDDGKVVADRRGAFVVPLWES